MNKTSRSLTALIVCMVLLAAAALLLFRQQTGISYANADQYTAGDTDISSPVENLDIAWASGRVNVEYHSGSGVSVSETASRPLSEDEKFRWWLDGATLRIQFDKPGFRLFGLFRSAEKQLTVSLPEGSVLKSAVIRASSADLNIAALAADEIVLETSSGDMAASTSARALAVTSTSGSADIRQAADLESGSFSSTSGSLGISLGSAKTVSAVSTSGSIGLKMSGSAESVVLRSTSGSISQETASADRSECSSTSGSVTVRPGAFRELQIHSTSGSTAAFLPESPGFTCEVSTSSGDFSSSLALRKDGNVYVCGDGSARCSVSTTSGNIRIEKEGAD